MRYRVYFNRTEDAPQVWSVDEGDISSEINVLGVITYTMGNSRHNLKAEYPEPKAWVEHEGTLQIKLGIAHIMYGDKDA